MVHPNHPTRGQTGEVLLELLAIGGASIAMRADHAGALLDVRPKEYAGPDRVWQLFADGSETQLRAMFARASEDGGLQETSAVLRSSGQRVSVATTRFGDELVLVASERDASTLHQLSFALQASAIGTWQWTRVDDCIVWDTRTAELFGKQAGYSPSSFEDYLALIHEADRGRVAEHIAAASEKGVYDDIEHRIGDGADTRWVLCKGEALRDADGNISSLIGAIVDVTERHLAAERRHQSQRLEAVGELAAGIAHNFNNMLAAIIPNLQLARRKSGDDVTHHLDAATSAAERASRMVRQLLLYAGSAPVTERRIEDLRPVVERLVDMCQATFGPTVELSTVLQPVSPVSVNTSQIEQALLNLLLNAKDACQANAEGGRITVSLLARDSGDVELRIQDDGIGMPASVRRRIFEPFFTTKAVGKGTGLGLSSCYAIVREHGGRLECESSPGDGTTFSIHLPASERTPEPPEAATQGQPSSGMERILIVDDEPLVRKVIGQTLSLSGYHVTAAADGVDAVQHLESDTFDLLLLDIHMPGMGGQAVMTHARRIAPEMKVVIFSGGDGSVEGADGTLRKPLGADELLARLRALLDGTDLD